MACSSCASRAKSVAKPASEHPLSATPSTDFTLQSTESGRVRSGSGQYYSIFASLVKFRPPSGWGLNVSVKGHDHVVDGQTAREVVTKVIQLYKDNDIVIEERNVWFNANLVWLNSVSERHTFVRRSDLAALASY